MQSNKSLDGRDKALTIFFQKIDVVKHVPCCMFLDLESTMIDEVGTNTYCQLFYPKQLISG